MVAGVYLTITIVMAVPFIDVRELGTATFAGDGRLIAWTIAWTNHAILERLPLFAANMFFPAPDALAYTEHMLGLGILALPLNLVTDNPALVFSILWLTAFWANAMAAHLLAFRFTGRHDAAIAAGLVFGWTFFRMSHAGHLQLQWTAWLPLSMWLFERWHARPTWWRLLGATGATLMQMLTSWYLAVLAALLSGAWLLWLFVVKGTRRRGLSVVQLAVASAIGAAVLVPLATPYMGMLGGQTEVVALENSADLRSYLSPPEDTWLGRRLEQDAGMDLRWIWGEQTLYLGWTALLLAVVGTGVLTTSFFRARGNVRRQHALPLFFAVLVAAAFWLSLGPSTTHVALFDALRLVPGVSLVRAPARFGLLVALGVAVLSAIGLAWCWERLEAGRRSKLVLVLVVPLSLTMLGEWRVVTPVGRTSPAPVPAIYGMLNALPPGAIVSLPDYRLGTEHYFRADYLLYSTAHWRPIVNGYGRGEPPEYLSIVERLSTFPSEGAATLSRRLGVRYFVIHTDRLGTRDSVEAAKGSADFRLVAAVGPDYMFEVVPDGK